MTTMPRVRTGDQLRDELLAAATDQLAQRLSVNPPSLRETARRCDVSPTAVYRHFSSQQALLDAIARRSLAALEKAITESQEGNDDVSDPTASLRAMAVAYAAWAVANPGAYQLLFEGRDLLDGSELIDSGIDRLQSRLERLLDGLPSGDRDAQLQAELLWIALHGLAVTRIRKTDQQWRQTVARDAASLVDAFID